MGIPSQKQFNSGMRHDLGCYFRSGWEANYARYLNFLISAGEIKSWAYEKRCFEFPGIKRGCQRYYPDFEVVNKNGSIEYHEVKGYMTQKARTALKRMSKYYPDVKVILIDKTIYSGIKRKLERVIEGWE